MPDPANACPIGFVSGSTGQCVPACQTARGLENRVVGGEPRCVYRQDETKFFALKSSPIVPLTSPVDSAPTLDWVRQYRPSLYGSYKDAQDDLTTKTALLLGQISSAKQVQDAFLDLQNAENARDASPQAYQNARIRYYTLTRGETWASDERRRLLDAEVLPTLAPYLQTINSLTERQSQQASTKTAVDAVKSKLLSMKDDFQAMTTTLSKQVDTLKNQIELEKRQAVVQRQQTYDWIVNIVLVILLLVVAVLLARKVMSTMSSANPKTAYTGVPPKS